MALDPSFWLGLLTPTAAPAQAQYDGAGFRQVGANLSHAKQRRVAQAQQQNSDDLARAKLALDKEKLEHDQKQARKKMFSEAMRQAGPELASGAQNRVDPALAAIQAAGGTIETDEVGDPAQYQAALPDGGLIPDLQMPWGDDPEAVPYGLGDMEGGVFGEDLQLQAPDIQGEVFEIAPDTRHEEQFIYDSEGNEIMQYDQGGVYDENVAEIEGTLEELADSYGMEVPVEADMLRSIATKAANAVLGSEGGTQEKAIKYASDLFNDMARLRMSEEGKDRRALLGAEASVLAAQSGEVNNDIAWARGHTQGMKALEKSDAHSSLQAAQMLSASAMELDRQIEAGEIDASYIAKVVFALAHANEPGNPRMTDQDFKMAFPPGTVFERLKNAFLEGMGDSAGDWEEGIMAALEGDTTISTQTAERLLKTVMIRMEEVSKLRAREAEKYRSVHQGMLKAGLYGAANGYADALVTAYPRMAEKLERHRPEEFTPQVARPGQPQAQRMMRDRMRGNRAKTQRELRDEMSRAPGDVDTEQVHEAQQALDALLNSEPGQGYRDVQDALHRGQFSPENAANARQLLDAYDQATAMQPFQQGITSRAGATPPELHTPITPMPPVPGGPSVGGPIVPPGAPDDELEAELQGLGL